MRLWVDILISFSIAALSGLGVGGGGLFALYLKLFSPYGQLGVQALNLVFFLFSASAALSVHLCRRRIYLLPVVIMIGFGIVGSLLGSTAAISLNSPLLGKLFGLMLILAGIYSFFSKGKSGRR